ncbi:MAG: hypothetical protein ACPGKS_06490 [Coraliomargarita sp.]
MKTDYKYCPLMQADDDAPLKISKWPFYLGDILLVATALAIAILGDWQLTDWQVLSCVLSVALGAGLFVLPYVVEYYLRIKEFNDDRDSHIRVLRSHMQQAESAIEVLKDELGSLEEDLSANGQADQVVIAAVDKKLEQFETLWATLTEHESKLEQAFAQLATVQDGTQVDKLTKRLNTLETALEKVVEAPSDLSKKVVALEATLEALANAVEVAHRDKPDARPTRSPRTRRKHEGGLLHRAIKEKQDASSEAVKRIIHSKTKAEPQEEEALDSEEAESEAKFEETGLEPEKVLAAEAEVGEPNSEPEPEPEPEPELDVIAGMDEVLVDDAEWDSHQIEVDPEALAAQALESATGAPEDSVVEPAELEAPKSSAKPDARPKAEVAPIDEAPGAAGADLFGDTVPAAAPKRRSRTKKSDAVLTVSVLIGIGNKPFLRGSGAGLNWDEGIQMEFQEIGKWRWVAPEDLEGPVELQVFRNDEDPDRNGKQILEPGQKLELSPVF